MTEVSQTAQETQVKLEIIRRLLKTNFPTTLSSRPLSRTLVLSDLVLQGRREDEHRYALHPIRLVEVRINLMQTFIVRRELPCRSRRLPFSKRDDLPFEIHHGSRVGPALESGFRHQIVVDAGEHRVDSDKLVLTLRLCKIGS